MTDIEFIPAKNGGAACKIRGVPLHSLYNPQKEAERFVSALECPFLPSYILITEPGMSYCAEFLRRRFPDAVLCAVRYADGFDKYDGLFDRTFSAHGGARQFEDALFSFMGEEGICSCLFAAWQPAAKIFPGTDADIWNAVRRAIVKSRAVLFTHSHFAARWLKNAFFLCANLGRAAKTARGAAPVVITASGPSLLPVLDSLKLFRSSFFLLALSSSLSVLLKNGLVPDAALSTDGGWWAKKHLEPLLGTDIPLALPAEGICQKSLLHGHPILPLKYEDGTERRLQDFCGIPAEAAARNGTVSGTAAEFALSLTSGTVFFCGLDLESGRGAQHAEPNRIEDWNAARDGRLSPKETRISRARQNAEALSLYRDWFSSRPASFSRRIVRIVPQGSLLKPLGGIRDAGCGFLEAELSRAQAPLPKIEADGAFSEADRAAVRRRMQEFLEENADSEEWLRSAFPAEHLAWRKSLSPEEKAEKRAAMEERNNALKIQLRSIVDAAFV